MNKRGLAHVRVAKPGAHHAPHKRSSCATGGFYISPSAGAVVSAGSPFNISWDTSCLPGTSGIDIYLFAPSLDTPRIHEWQNVNYALGSYQTILESRWWNNTSPISLQLSIVSSGSQPFLNQFAAAPVFTATYTAPTSGSTPSYANENIPDTVTYVNNFPTNSSLSKGKIAVGVLIPLLFIALGIYFYIKRSRTKGKEKRRRFSEAIDKRMSTISSDWKSITAAGATAAIRSSMAVSSTTGNRSSAFDFGAIRPTSTMAVEGDSASAEKQSIDLSRMSQLRPGVRASAFGERVSRVSFAADVRPSMESRRTTATSRVFRTSLASSLVPPLPIPQSPLRNDTGDMSPTQTRGAQSLTAEDIQSRLDGDNPAESLSNVEEVWPSLSLMRTGNDQEAGDDYLLPQKKSVDLPMPPFPVHPAPTSSAADVMPVPDNVMSPDEMLRAYATRKMASPPTSPIAFPARTLSYHGTSMRTLYASAGSTPDATANNATEVTQTPEAEKRYTPSYASVDPYAGFNS